MLHFTATVRCVLCLREFAVGFAARDKVDADARLGAEQAFDVRCPGHGGPLHLLVDGGAFRRVEAPPPPAPTPEQRMEKRKRWWRWWA